MAALLKFDLHRAPSAPARRRPSLALVHSEVEPKVQRVHHTTLVLSWSKAPDGQLVSQWQSVRVAVPEDPAR